MFDNDSKEIDVNDYDDIDIKSNGSGSNANKDKWINDFSITQDDDDKNYSFGTYLNFWQKGYDNSVTPKYKTLKEELLTNGIRAISKKIIIGYMKHVMIS